MFPSNSWSPSKQKTYASSPLQVDGELYPSEGRSKSPFDHTPRSTTSYLHNLSRNLYLRYLLSLLLGLFLGRTIFAPVHYHLPSLPYHRKPQEPVVEPAPQWINSTLGTAAIITLNSVSRPDRRDYLALMAGMTGLDLTYMSAWTTKPTQKALPNEHNPNLKDVEYACWRSHADAWRQIVEKGWETAMIMEDDGDWDGGIHQSMAIAWEALKNITNDPLATTEAKSYHLTRILLILDGIFFIRGRVWIILRRVIWCMTTLIFPGLQLGGLIESLPTTFPAQLP